MGVGFAAGLGCGLAAGGGAASFLAGDGATGSGVAATGAGVIAAAGAAAGGGVAVLGCVVTGTDGARASVDDAALSCAGAASMAAVMGSGKADCGKGWSGVNATGSSGGSGLADGMTRSGGPEGASLAGRWGAAPKA